MKKETFLAATWKEFRQDLLFLTMSQTNKQADKTFDSWDKNLIVKTLFVAIQERRSFLVSQETFLIFLAQEKVFFLAGK